MTLKSPPPPPLNRPLLDNFYLSKIATQLGDANDAIRVCCYIFLQEVVLYISEIHFRSNFVDPCNFFNGWSMDIVEASDLPFEKMLLTL